ncbi:MAG: magnesium transporter MgtE N-terminal domain-containing protein [Anaerolineae bacterium]
MSTFLSQILGRPVYDAQGQRLGRCLDILVRDVESGFPPMRALHIQDESGQDHLVAADAVAWLSPSIILKSSELPTYTPRGDELWLKKQVLDRQLVDTEGRRLVRVNDLQMARAGKNGQYNLMGVNVGTLSLLRRLGTEGLARGLFRALRHEPPEVVIPWQDVASVQPDAPIRLRVSRDRLSQLHPADIANIVAELDRETGQALLDTLDTETVADTMSEIEPELQMSMLATMEPERAADVLEEMDPDDAADLLADMEPDDRRNLLQLMEREDATQVEKLLAYPEDSAGGIMTTEFVTMPEGLTVAQALDYLRRSPEAQEDEALYYVHIVDGRGCLVGVVALRDLVMADPVQTLDEIMEHHPITVELTTPQAEVARTVAKYNLLAVPVVDEENCLHGMVTVDDAIDAIIPTAWKKHLPRFF